MEGSASCFKVVGKFVYCCMTDFRVCECWTRFKLADKQNAAFTSYLL